MIVDKITALLDGLSSEELDRLPPARLRQFSELCWHWHSLAERRLRPKEPKPASVGVLSALRNGERGD
jgi:hypothetical protein